MKIYSMAVRFIYMALMTVVSLTATAQAPDTVFAREWAVIDSMITNNDLTKTALQQVTLVHEKAKQRNLPVQVLKSLIYRYTLTDRIQDDEPAHIIKTIEAEIAKTTDPVQKAVLYSILAKQYQQYFNNQRYNIYNRSNTNEGNKKSIDTWSAEDFTEAIKRNFRLSLSGRNLLQQVRVEKYDAVIIPGKDRHLRPTLYDLLAHEALDYFKNAERYNTKPAVTFTINDPGALAPVAAFVGEALATTDTSSSQWQALRIFQQLLSFRQADTNKNALVTLDLERLEWVYQKAVFTGKETIYETALRALTDQYASVPATAGAWYLLARLEMDKAGRYTANADTSHRFSYNRAEEIVRIALQRFPGPGYYNASLKNLLAEINTLYLHTEIEKVNVPDKPFRALVSYRNTSTLYGKIIHIEDNNLVVNNRWQPGFWKTVKELPAYKTFIQSLPATNDHQQHSTEIKIDGLPVGEYALVSSTSSGFSDSTGKLFIHFFHVSNISYIRNGSDYFVLNRETGYPLARTRVSLVRERYSGTAKKNVSDTIARLQADNNGHFSFNPSRQEFNTLKFRFATDNDWLYFNENEYGGFENVLSPDDPGINEEIYEKRMAHVFFFTDRSIYRPGQTVFFKGIGVTKDHTTNRSKALASKDSGWVYLKDVNNRSIDSIRYGFNDYGSFSGRFILPQNTITGNFQVTLADPTRSTANFSVEEYKRPAFSVSFDKVKGAYRLNDSIIITGNAKAYAGNNISGAKVVYNVVRNYRYQPYAITRRIPAGNSQRQVINGELFTDANGKFTIRFKALADDITDRSGNPLFDFAVQANVTDLTGETRSATSHITAGFTALQLNLVTPAVSDKDSSKQVQVTTTNMSGEKEPARVQLKIYALQVPDRLIRKRYWQRPDQFVMTKETFIRYFPTDEYDNETDQASWQKGALLQEKTVETKDSSFVTLPAGSLPAGHFRIEGITKDKYGEEVTQQVFTQVFDRSSGRLPAPEYQFAFVPNTTAEPGETITFLTGTAASRIFVISNTTSLSKKNNFQYRTHTNGIRAIRYQPEEKERGGVIISEAYVYDSRIYTRQFVINVPWTNKQLDVRYESYRNKTEPGSPEKWTVSIQGHKSDSVAAELLTSMYDASLDQFKAHNWNIPYVWPAANRNNLFSSNQSFLLSYVTGENNPPYQYFPGTPLQHDRLVSSAQELWIQALMTVINNPATSTKLRNEKQLALQQLYTTRNQKGGRGMVYDAQTLSARMPGVMVTQEAALNKQFAGVAAASDQVQIRGTANADPALTPLFIIDGEAASDINGINPSDIISMETMNIADATAKYGASGKNGAVIITTRGKAPVLQVRKDFSETAFFFPHLTADVTGKYSFSFTMPESVTQWKWISLAHTRDLSFGSQSTLITTQKKLMVQPNAPRFVREGDHMELSSKIVNLTDKEIKGQATLELIDPATNTPVDGWFQNVFPVQYFTAEAGQSAAIKFPIQIPFSYNKPLTWRIVARSENMSDGEEHTLPVLTNRMLVTETLPLFLASDTTKQFTFEKLRNNKSESLTHESITVEYTSNPVWYAVQALPYLVDFPYECAEQTFNRFYANTLASFIINRHPRIKQVFEAWKADSTAFISNLQKNEELKQVLLQETPWVLQAETETQQKKNLALLFDLVRLGAQSDLFIKKLAEIQLPDGSFSWFKGGQADRYITNYILTGIGKLKRLGALTPDLALRIRPLLSSAMQYMDGKIATEYDKLVMNKADLSKQQIYSGQVEYLYMRSFFRDMAQSAPKAYDYYYKQGKQFWITQNSYHKAQLGLVYFRNKEEAFARNTILPALLENTVENSKMGMYWKTSYTGFWYQSPVEHQSMMIAFVSEIEQDAKAVSLTKQLNAMKTWLLLNKQTNNWRTTVATADACYALLLNGSDWLSAEKTVTIRLGNVTTVSNNVKTEAGTGYFKKRIDGKLVNNEMGNISVDVTSSSQVPNSKTQTSPSWGSIYWQYFEDLDKITPAASPLSLVKKLFIEKNTDKGKVLQLVKENEEMKVGDKVIVRLELRSDRDMDYLHLKDMRAASMEPVNILSGYKWQDRLGYYESTKDASTSFFIDHLSKGSYVFEYPLFITHAGVFSAGIANIQCMYAPEFSSHSEGIKIRVINP